MKKLHFFSSIALSGAIALLAACGQKGPLYLPVKPVPPASNSSTTQTPAQTPAEDKKPGE